MIVYCRQSSSIDPKVPLREVDMYLCPDCISVDGGCCCDIFTEDWKIILLPSEIERLSTISGLPQSRFVNDEPLSKSQRKLYTTGGALYDPLWAELMSLWPRPTGIKHHCPFLIAKGCILPYHAKPFICQVFPLDFSITSGLISVPENSRCEVVHQLKTLEGIVAYFKDDCGALQQAFAEYRREFIQLLQAVKNHCIAARTL